MPKGFRSALAAALDPLADGGIADAHGLGDAALGPTLLLEMPGSKTSRFLPGVRLAAHAWECSTRPPLLKILMLGSVITTDVPDKVHQVGEDGLEGHRRA